MKTRFDHRMPGPRVRVGAAAVEFAMVLPFLMLAFSAAVDFGRIFNTTQVLERAANTGAMYASGTLWVPTSQTSQTDAAVSAACSEGSSLNPQLSASNVVVTTTSTTVTVTVTYNYPLITAVLIPTATVQLQRSVIDADCADAWQLIASEHSDDMCNRETVMRASCIQITVGGSL